MTEPRPARPRARRRDAVASPASAGVASGRAAGRACADPLADFHPATAAWFRRSFPAPTAAQAAAWPAIAAGRHTLVAAPTGSGKTLTGFLATIDALVRRGLQPGGLPDETVVVYVSPLKALSNDIRANLEAPLAGIRAELSALGLPDVAIRTGVRTGDTPPAERRAHLRRPPQVIVTTPESLYVLLGSTSGRRMLATVRTVIVDEIHALADGKRGSHLALSLERLQALVDTAAAEAGRPPRPLTRVGLSATQKPVDEVARFLVGAAAVGADGTADCAVIDIGYGQRRDLALELPPTPLSAVMSNDQWTQVYARIVELAAQHRTTLVFVNTRRMAERAARHLGELLGKERVAAHHGSLARELRLDAEQRLKRGELTLLVATASLELGLDIGDVDLVCQLGSPRSISTFLQRAGRSGHAVGGVPKARLFPQTRDELVECAALLDCVRRGELDVLHVPPAPLDVLAQQIVAETACRDWDEDALFALARRAWPYARLTHEAWRSVVRMVSEGIATRQGQRAAQVHRDAVHHRLRERRGARMTALTSGGTIPDTGDYAVVLEPQADRIGSVHEDFAVESLAGDVFQLGNASYRILRIEPGKVRVEDAKGAAPNIPFWLGEAPGRSDELSSGVSRLRAEVGERLRHDGTDATARWLAGDEACAPAPAGRPAGTDTSEGPTSGNPHGPLPPLALGVTAAAQLADHLARAQSALGELPTQDCIVLERFFDASGGMQLVIHSPHGSRLNRAWGLALRKRFCRKFNFELQAAATEDAIVLSLSTSHSFPLEEVARYLHSATALDVLVQALLDAPLFGVRWRWNATTALALPRFSGGRPVAPQLQRMRSEDLLAAVFPDQVACAENLAGDREVPDHPLVAQTLHDCLHDAMDAAGWLRLLRRLEDGEVRVVARDLPAPSPLAAEVLTARPYAFLDDAPLEERRTQAVQARRYGDADGVDAFGELDAAAIADVRDDAWPRARDADEMHEALMSLGSLTVPEAAAGDGWEGHLAALARDGRATRLCPVGADGALWVAAERLAMVLAVHPGAHRAPPIAPVRERGDDAAPDRPAALADWLRARLGGLGPTTADALAGMLAVPAADVDAALLALQAEGSVLRGRFTPGAPVEEWCERHLLARIHRATLRQLRREIEPVEPRDFQRFLFDWQGLSPASRASGPDALPAVLSRLEGVEAPAALWESELLPARLDDYASRWLDDACAAGRVAWARLRPLAADSRAGAASLRAAPILLLPRRHLGLWAGLAAVEDGPVDPPGRRAARVLDTLEAQGASFFDEIADGARLLPVEVEEGLGELVVRGRVHADSFAGLRALMVPSAKRPSAGGPRRRGGAPPSMADAGRWSLIRARLPSARTLHGTGADGDIDAGAAGSTDTDSPTPRQPAVTTPATATAISARDEAVEHVVRRLLQRYGVVCWRLLEREPGWLPPWRDLARICRRLEARGEIRGGRFIAGPTGEQFALPEAIARMRAMRQQAPDGALVALSACDPANLLGALLPGPRLPRVAGSRVLYRDGVPVATLAGGRFEALVALDGDELRAARLMLTLDPTARPAPCPALTPAASGP